MTTVETCTKQAEWDREILTGGGHPLQLWGWGEVKALHNWRVERIFVRKEGEVIGAAQLLIRSLPLPLRALVYVPRGPMASKENRLEVLDMISKHSKDVYGAVAISIEPDWEGVAALKGWKRSSNTILIPRTIILDLSRKEDELLSAMTKKTRQYIRKSNTENVEVRKVRSQQELRDCLSLYKETARRAQFGIHDDGYYFDIFEKLGDHSPIFASFKEGKPIAFLWLAISQATAFELYGGVNEEGQSLRVNYALKWYAIQTMKKWGIEKYDFNGLLNDGVSTFKQGFADHESMLVGTYDKPLSPLYGAWAYLLPMAKSILRRVKKR